MGERWLIVCRAGSRQNKAVPGHRTPNLPGIASDGLRTFWHEREWVSDG